MIDYSRKKTKDKQAEWHDQLVQCISSNAPFKSCSKFCSANKAEMLSTIAIESKSPYIGCRIGNR